jgi:hypothetical protein
MDVGRIIDNNKEKYGARNNNSYYFNYLNLFSITQINLANLTLRYLFESNILFNLVFGPFIAT